MTEIRSIAAIALGANLPSVAGDPALTLGQAMIFMQNEGLLIRAVSRFFRTPCFPAGQGPDYVNATVVVSTEVPVPDILAKLNRIEHEFGRARTQRWGMRTLDLDILAIDHLILPDVATQRHWMDLSADVQKRAVPDQLIVPHPRLQDRAFVLVPMADVAPDWVHPVLHKSVVEMRDQLPAGDRAGIVPL